MSYAQEARELFDALSNEIYYGFNMKIVLTDMIARDSVRVVALKAIIKECKEARLKK